MRTDRKACSSPVKIVIVGESFACVTIADDASATKTYLSTGHGSYACAFAAAERHERERRIQHCDCGAADAEWHGDTLRVWCCDACWRRAGREMISER